SGWKRAQVRPGCDARAGRDRSRARDARRILRSRMRGCAEELRVVRQLAGEYGPRGLRAVVVDVGTDDRQAASRALVEVEGAGIPVLGDRGQVQARRWLGSRPQLPALFVVDRDGAVGAMAGACGPEAVTSLRAA